MDDSLDVSKKSSQVQIKIKVILSKYFNLSYIFINQK